MLKVDEPSGRLLFEEKQKFPTWILILVLIITTSSVLVAFGTSIALGYKTPAGREALWIALAITIPIEIIMVYIFYTVRLEKVVTSNGLYFRWPPLQKKYRVLEENMIEKVEARTAPPASYGAKWVPGYGKVHNLSGEGLQCYLVSGKKMFFGTDEKVLFQKAVEQMLGSNRKFPLREF